MDAVEIPLRDREGAVRAVAIVDPEDAHLAEVRWCLNRAGYAHRHPRKQSAQYLHRAVLGVGPGDRRQVDHVNGDKLDCRRANLRLVSKAQNMQNLRGAHRDARSKHRGVSYDPRWGGRWVVRVTVNGKTHYTDRPTEEEAAAAAADLRRRLMPFSEADRVAAR